MSEQRRVNCELFDAHVDELALGQIDEPLRGELLTHAADCARCRASLDGLGAVTDRLLLAAPQVEPPPGFESRVLARIEASAGGSAQSSTGRRWWIAGAAAIALLVVMLTGALVVLRTDDDAGVETAAIVAANGSEIGFAQLREEPSPHVVVTIDNPRPGPGIRTCELRRPDGEWEEVGWWDAAGIASGVWAVGIDPALLDATAMRVTSDGEVLATATFD